MLDSENEKLRQEVGGENIGSAPACQVGKILVGRTLMGNTVVGKNIGGKNIGGENIGGEYSGRKTLVGKTSLVLFISNISNTCL